MAKETYHQRAPNDRIRSGERAQRVGDVDGGHTLLVGHHVAQVTDVALLVGRRAMSLAQRVEMRPGRSAAIGVVAEFVN